MIRPWGVAEYKRWAILREAGKHGFQVTGWLNDPSGFPYLFSTKKEAVDMAKILFLPQSVVRKVTVDIGLPY